MSRGVGNVRVLTAFAAAILVAALAATAAAAPTGQARQQRALVTLAGLEEGVLADVNAYRVGHGLVPLQLSAELTEAAQEHSDQMVADGYFAHRSPDGSSFWQRIGRFYGWDGTAYWSVGENLLWSSPDVDAQKALDLWIASPEHRRNLLTARWREIGISAVHAVDAPGAFDGRDVTIVTTDFGVRR